MDLITLAVARKYTDDSIAGVDGILKGEKGDPGPVGPQGEQGPQGLQGEGIENILSKGQNSYVFGIDNQALSANSVATGKNSIAGTKGFYIYSIVKEGLGGKIYLTSSSENPMIPGSDVYEEDFNYYDELAATISEKDVSFSVQSNGYYQWPRAAKITGINKNCITYEGEIDQENFWYDREDNEGQEPQPFIFFIDDFLISEDIEAGVTIGKNSFASGSITMALADESHAEGLYTKAISRYGHAEGSGTVAGYASHAEGKETEALGLHTHAEGRSTLAKGNNSHAEGGWTKSIGNQSHAEGYGTETAGACAHAEGFQTQAKAHSSHSEGIGTIATENYQHVQGKYNALDENGKSGNYAHIVGWGTETNRKNIHTLTPEGEAWFAGDIKSGNEKIATEKYVTQEIGKKPGVKANSTGAEIFNNYSGDLANKASGNYSHAEGNKTQAIANQAHAEGYNTTAAGPCSHVEGFQSVAESHSNHAEGYLTKAGDPNDRSQVFGAHAEGSQTQATAEGAHAEGSQTQATAKDAHAEGYKTIASGANSHADGQRNRAFGIASYAGGAATVSLGSATHTEGLYTLASNNGSHAGGYYSKATGDFSFAHGSMCVVSGANSAAMGRGYYFGEAFSYTVKDSSGEETSSVSPEQKYLITIEFYQYENMPDDALLNIPVIQVFNKEENKEVGSFTVATGNKITEYKYEYETYPTKAFQILTGHSLRPRFPLLAAGTNSLVVGTTNRSSYDSTLVAGKDLLADNDYQTCLGIANAPVSLSLLTIGNGKSSHILEDDGTLRSNAFIVNLDGTIQYNQSAQSETGADYAEYFEWEDGNPNGEDRVGYLVTLSNDKIRFATDEDDDILGAVTGTAAIIGDTAGQDWAGKYQTDEFGRTIFEYKEEFSEEEEEKITFKDDSDEPVIETTMIKKSLGIFPRRILNPNYDPSQTYIPRSKRQEWDTIGLMGKLHVRDDGTCVPGKYATIGTPGIATFSEAKTNMRVMKRINDNVILVLLK